MMKELIGHCGLDCEKCDARVATINNDNELRSRTAKLWCEWNNTDEIKPEPKILAPTYTIVKCQTSKKSAVYLIGETYHASFVSHSQIGTT